MDTDKLYAAAWEDLRKRWRLCKIFVFGYIPVGIVALGLGSLLHTDVIFLIIVIPWFVAIPLSSIYAQLFRCPRCKKIYANSPNPFHWLSDKGCGYCALPLWAPSDPGNMSAGIAARKLQRKQSWVLFFPFFLSLLAIITTITYVVSARSLQPRKLATRFIQQLQTHQYKTAHDLLSIKARERLTVQTLQEQWETMEQQCGVIQQCQPYVGGWPGSKMSIYCQIPTTKCVRATTRIDLILHNNNWQIENFQFHPAGLPQFSTNK